MTDVQASGCPLCGSAAKWTSGPKVVLSSGRYWVTCASDWCRMRGPVEADQRTAVERWNDLCRDIRLGREAREWAAAILGVNRHE